MDAEIKCFEKFLKQEAPEKIGAQLTQQCITQRHLFMGGYNSSQTGWGKDPGPWEDAKAFLASFEQVAQACQWPREEWVAQLLPALSGEAQEAFGSLETKDREDYGKVKAAILRREANRMEALRQHFRQFRSREVEDPRRIYGQLQELCRRWLRPERHSKEQILELLILEQFLAILPPELQSWIRAGGAENCTQAAALVDDFLRSRQEAEAWQTPPDLKAETVSLGEPEGTGPETGPSPMYWEVMEEGGENVDSVGGWLLPKSEPELEDPRPIQAPENGATSPGGRCRKQNKSEALSGYSQSNDGWQPEAYKARPSLAQPQRIHQGQEGKELAGTGERPEDGVSTPVNKRRHQRPERRHKTSLSPDLIRSLRIHAGDSSYSCVKCGKTFKQKSALNGHQSVHTSKRKPRGRRPPLHWASSPRMLQGNKEPNTGGKENPQKEAKEPEEFPQNTIPEEAAKHEQESELKGHPEEESTTNQNDTIRLLEHSSSAEGDARTMWVKKLLYLQDGQICPHGSGRVPQGAPHLVEKPPCSRLVSGQPILRRSRLKGNPENDIGEKFHGCRMKLRSEGSKERQTVGTGEKHLL
ncbi:uncharacterized protein LOC143834030 isoform X2 [Paroedura picta]|uniref:uncharacterized protein LOC143834030 isoform X2 n=1 Tax=Paroedura picta TaxID=143630 RepID=UPI004056C9AC